MDRAFYPHELDRHPDRDRFAETINEALTPLNEDIASLEGEIESSDEAFSELGSCVADSIVPAIELLEKHLGALKDKGEINKEDWGVLLAATTMLDRENIYGGEEVFLRVKDIHKALTEEGAS